MVSKHLKALADRLGNATLPVPSPPKKERKNLPRDADGKPLLFLTPPPNTVVHTPTQDAYDLLMRVCECARYSWHNEDRPTTNDNWPHYEGETCIGIELDSNRRKTFLGYAPREFFQKYGNRILSPEEFYTAQRIFPAMLEEITQYFNQTDPGQ